MKYILLFTLPLRSEKEKQVKMEEPPDWAKPSWIGSIGKGDVVVLSRSLSLSLIIIISFIVFCCLDGICAITIYCADCGDVARSLLPR